MTVDDITNGMWFAAAAMLTVALFLTCFRLITGPGTLDRLVSLDTFSAIAQCSIGVYIAWTRDTTPAAAMIALAIVAFIGSVAVARYRVPDDVGAIPAEPTLRRQDPSEESAS